MDEKTSKNFNNFSVKTEFANIKNEKNIKTEGKKEYMNQAMSNKFKNKFNSYLHKL